MPPLGHGKQTNAIQQPGEEQQAEETAARPAIGSDQGHSRLFCAMNQAHFDPADRDVTSHPQSQKQTIIRKTIRFSLLSF